MPTQKDRHDRPKNELGQGTGVEPLTGQSLHTSSVTLGPLHRGTTIAEVGKATAQTTDFHRSKLQEV